MFQAEEYKIIYSVSYSCFRRVRPSFSESDVAVGEWFFFPVYLRKQILSLIFEITLCAVPFVVLPEFVAPLKN